MSGMRLCDSKYASVTSLDAGWWIDGKYYEANAEPWSWREVPAEWGLCSNSGPIYEITNSNGNHVISGCPHCGSLSAVSSQTVRRIVACVNACTGTPTAWLENNIR